MYTFYMFFSTRKYHLKGKQTQGILSSDAQNNCLCPSPGDIGNVQYINKWFAKQNALMPNASGNGLKKLIISAEFSTSLDHYT